MFIETQSGKLISMSSLKSIERLSNEIYGFVDNSTGGSVLIYAGENDFDAEEEFDRIKQAMKYYCILIGQEGK